MLRWMLPVDDTCTKTIGWRYVNKALDPRDQGDRDQIGKEKIDFVGQTPDRPYEEQQQFPGDYEAQVSQRPIAIHALEHLATSDRGVAKLRRLIRKNIHAIAEGKPAKHPVRINDHPIATFCQDTVFPVAANGNDDQQRTNFGQRIADNVLEHIDQSHKQRADLVLQLCQQEFTT